MGVMMEYLENFRRIRWRAIYPSHQSPVSLLAQPLHMQHFLIAEVSPGLTGAECRVPLAIIS